MESGARTRNKTLDEIIADIRTIAEGAESDGDRLRALKMLKDFAGDSGAQLPKLRSRFERHVRLCRVMRGAGRAECQRAWRRLWPSSIQKIDTPPVPSQIELTHEHRKAIQAVRNLRDLYRMFPEVKKPGVPLGYPMHGSLVVKMDWCREQAEKALRYRLSKEAVNPKDPDDALYEPTPAPVQADREAEEAEAPEAVDS